MRQSLSPAPAPSPAEALAGGAAARQQPARWQRAAWALAASVLVHVWVLGALSSARDSGRMTTPNNAATATARAATLASGADHSPAPRRVELAATPALAPPQTEARGAVSSQGDVARSAQAQPPAPWQPAAAQQPLSGSATAPTAAAVSALAPSTDTKAVSGSTASASPTAVSATPATPATLGAPAPAAPTAPTAPATPQNPSPRQEAQAKAATAPAAGTEDDAHPPPVYATRPPPDFRWSYALRRGAMSGQAELSLQRTGGGYSLDLKGTVLGLEVLGMSSRGGFGPQGLLPERFVDRRRGKDRLAANFDHAAGRITYSGTSAAQALLPGAQDRLSWMVQLAAILEAAPASYRPGSRIALSVSGARSDVDTWNFVVQGPQRLTLASGATVDAVRLTREPRRPYDTQVEAWLDPAQHHLPVRARLTVLPGGETLELSLLPP